jgi:precorrin-6B methylase 2
VKNAKYPVVDIDWEAADAFAKWAGKRLPTEAEWQMAAAGREGYTYPWGNEWKPNMTDENSIQRHLAGQYPSGASPFGLEDMAGNVFHWTCSSWKCESPGLHSDKKTYIVRAGTMGFMQQWNRTDYRIPIEEDMKAPFLGFRCVKPVNPEDPNLKNELELQKNAPIQSFNTNEADRQIFSYELNPGHTLPEDMQLTINKMKKGSNSADIGTGLGYLAYALAKKTGKTGNVYAVDIDKSVLDFVDLYIASAGIKNIKSVCSKPDNIMLPENSCDEIYMLGALSHIHPAICQNFMASCRKALKKNGRLIISDSLKYQNVANAFKVLEQNGFKPIESKTAQDPRYSEFRIYRRP